METWPFGGLKLVRPLKLKRESRYWLVITSQPNDDARALANIPHGAVLEKNFYNAVKKSALYITSRLNITEVSDVIVSIHAPSIYRPRHCRILVYE